MNQVMKPQRPPREIPMEGNRLPIELWEGPTYQDILDIDDQFHESSDIVREHRMVDLGTEPVKASRYTSEAFFEKEVEHVFFKTWQYAVREEEIPEPGDTYVYDLCGRSLIICRQQDRSIRAFENVCKHRGRQLVSQGGCKDKFRCPYHAFTWEIDGRFRPGPVHWDFPEIEPDQFGLDEVMVDTFGGFVFVNFDPAGPPLEEVLGPLKPHMEYWMINEVYKAAHVAKIVPANWKVCAEAFLEQHHLAATHPQVNPYSMDANAQYDVLSDHVTRSISPHGYPGLLYTGPRLSPQEIIDLAQRNGNKAGAAGDLVFDEATMTERHYMATTGRKNLSQRTGRDLSDRCDADFIDGFSYDLFPNFHIWGSLATKISYRFRPNGRNHEECLMEVFLFKLAPLDGPPPPAPMQMLGPDDKWSSCTGELAYLAGVYDQDESNLPQTQIGLRQLGKDGVVHFGRYCEVRCRNLHRMIDAYIARGEALETGPA